MTGNRALVREVNKPLLCVLCSGYLIEATTIVECLHSFCRSCLVKYLESSKFCPICDVQLHKNNPLLSVRCDPTLQQLVYKLIPGLYANEMARRRKYYSELGGPSSGSDTDEYPVADAYFSPDDSISLSLEFTGNKDTEDQDNVEVSPIVLDKQGIHRRYLQCPAAVTMSHLKKFLRMKYSLNQDHKVDILYGGESLTDDFSLIDVAYTFSWNKGSPMRFKYRFVHRPTVQVKPAKEPVKVNDKTQKVEMDSKKAITMPPLDIIIPSEDAKMQPSALPVQNTIVPVNKMNVEPGNKPLEKPKEKPEVKVHNINGKRELPVQIAPKSPVYSEEMEQEEISEPEPKKQKLDIPEPAINNFGVQEKSFADDIQEEDDDEDRLRISASEEDVNTAEEKSMDVEPPAPVPVVKSEERRKGKKKSKKEKHRHHHRHHDLKRDASPPAATILHSPENDIMKLKVKLTTVKNCNSKVTKYTVVEGGEDKKEQKEISHHPKPVEKAVFDKPLEEEKPKQKEEDTRRIEQVNNKVEALQKRLDQANKEKLIQMRAMRHKTMLKQNGPLLKPEPMKMPPSSITVSKITAEEKRQMEQQKLLAVRNNGADAESKRPSLEIMLVNAPGKGDSDMKPLEPKKAMRPTPPSIPLVRLNRGMPRGPPFAPKGPPPQAKPSPPPKLSPPPRPSPPPKPPTPGRPAKPHLRPEPERPDSHDDSGALDLSEKSSRKSPDAKSGSPRPAADPSSMRNLMTLTDTAVHIRSLNILASQDTGGPHTLKIPQVPPSLSLGGKPSAGYPGSGARKPGPNQSVRQIPNPSALLYRQHALNGRPLPPPVLPLSSLRKMETMTRNIEKVAAGLSVKAAVEAGYGAK